METSWLSVPDPMSARAGNMPRGTWSLFPASAVPHARRMTNTPQSTLIMLSTDESWSLLLDMAVARLAVVVDGQPEIFPVNYLVHDGGILIRTRPGTKLAGALGGRVCLEVDDYDPRLTGSAWSVVVKGSAREIRAEDTPDTIDVPQFQWHAGSDAKLLRIEPDDVSGRRYEMGGAG